MSRFGGKRDYGGGSSERGSNKTYVYVRSQDCGKIIGKGGSKIRELQESTGAHIKVSRDDQEGRMRKVELSGSQIAVEEAQRLIDDLLNQSRNHTIRREDVSVYGDARNGKVDNDWNETSTPQSTWNNNSKSVKGEIINFDEDDGWNEEPVETWTSAFSSGGRGQMRGTCHKCGEAGHFSRDCPQQPIGMSDGVAGLLLADWLFLVRLVRLGDGSGVEVKPVVAWLVFPPPFPSPRPGNRRQNDMGG